MATTLTERIRQNPDYQALLGERNAFGWLLTAIICILYYGFILAIAFDKELLATPVSASGVTSWGIPIAFGIIVVAVALTGIYVRRANGRYDAIIKKILEKEGSA
ncbi:MAG: DUF485 domain-containing protein [Zoogloeaceae bacterium]|jgi:uncharacterized membrane protein (DUF485 family)|nr:DUF485 domain-containing protein [Zoogloeaceae bacterium]